MDRATLGNQRKEVAFVSHMSQGQRRSLAGFCSVDSLSSAHLSYTDLLGVLDSGLVRLQGQAAGSEQGYIYTGLLSYQCQLPNQGRQKGKEAISLHPVTSSMGAGGIFSDFLTPF